MRFAENTRAVIYWLTDLLRGGSVGSHYREIRILLEEPLSSNSIEIHEKYLARLLQYSTKNVSFYSIYSGYSSLSDFPVINKNLIRDNLKYFLANGLVPQKLHKVTTSGSTGAPLSIWQDKMKRDRHIAEDIYFSEIANYHLGSRLYYLRVWNEMNRKNLFLSRMQNIKMQDASNLSDKNLELFLKELERDHSTKSILAFSSTFEALAQYMIRTSRKVNTNVNCLITISETLPEGARKILKETFRCPVISRYSNMENGFLGQQCGDESCEYHINTAGFHIELLHPDRDEPVVTGETGRIVVTDLFNFGMPLIRYDTGDMAVLSKESACGKPGPVFASIEGRRVDFIYDTSGNLLSPHVITNTMWRYSSEIQQFQFIQRSQNKYTLKLNTYNGSFSYENRLILDIKKFIGGDSYVEVEYVDGIPLLASGKRKKIINNHVRQ